MRTAIANAVLGLGLIVSGWLAAVAVWSVWTFELPQNAGAVSSGIMFFLIAFVVFAAGTHLVLRRLARRELVAGAMVRRHLVALGVLLAIAIGVHLWSVRVWQTLASPDLAALARLDETDVHWAWQTLAIATAVQALVLATQMMMLCYAGSTAIRGKP
jgi:hypothetical protein